MRPLGSLALLAALSLTWGGEPKPRPAGSFFDALTETINVGADLYNKEGDIAGCFRLYQGALLAARPNLATHPDVLKDVDEALKKANGQPRMVDRAFTLRTALGQVREKFRPAKEEPKKVEVKKEEPKKEATKPLAKGPKETDGKLSGKILVDGKPGPTGYLTLIGSDQRTFSTFIQESGVYQFRTGVPAGKYRVTLETAQKEKGPAPKGQYPKRFRDPATSGLSVVVGSGAQSFNLEIEDEPK